MGSILEAGAQEASRLSESCSRDRAAASVESLNHVWRRFRNLRAQLICVSADLNRASQQSDSEKHLWMLGWNEAKASVDLQLNMYQSI